MQPAATVLTVVPVRRAGLVPLRSVSGRPRGRLLRYARTASFALSSCHGSLVTLLLIACLRVLPRAPLLDQQALPTSLSRSYTTPLGILCVHLTPSLVRLL